MKSAYEPAAARDLVARYAPEGVSKDLALRVYTTRLLGRDPALVLHGGGNTSVKTTARGLLGDEVRVLCVKGSGWEMGDIEPAGLPAVRLDPLLALRRLDRLSDEDMVSFQRGQLLSSRSPNPSVETLLHAFLPQKFIDHTHSTAVLALTDQPDDEALLRAVYGDRVAQVPYVKPGFDLAVTAARIYETDRPAEGLILRKHGIFTFGETAREAYERMVALVTLAERRLEQGRTPVFPSARLPTRIASAAEVAPILRGHLAVPSLSEGEPRRMVLAFRAGREVREYVDGVGLDRYSQVGVATPDHTIRTKNWPLVLPAPAAGKLDRFAKESRTAVERFVDNYRKYFERHNGLREPPKNMLDPVPRVVLVPGLGLFGVGRSVSAARVAADIAENTVRVVRGAESIGRYRPVSEADMFDVEYWSLEQAKLGNTDDPPFAGQVVVVTGGASGIGAATARAFWNAGAAVVVIDSDAAAGQETAAAFGARGQSIPCDVTDRTQVATAFDRACEGFGGVDVVVSNAGAAWQGAIADVADPELRASFELNFWAHQAVAQNAVRVFRLQGTGGVLLFNASKQAVNPGANFGPYGLPKAATLFLAKQYALEHGGDGIRVNALNADRVRTNIFAGGLLEERAAVRGLSVEEYLRTGNLLQREVTTDDVAQAFVALAQARATTAATMTVDGGNIAASLR